MPSYLDDVVKAMMFEPTEERPDSTLGWDVVVNYAADELNKLLEDSYKAGKGQLKVINLEMEKEDPRSGETYTLKVRLDLAAPLIQFVTNGIDSSTCSLRLPIVGGLIDPGVNPTTIPDKTYSLVISRIDLATVDGTTRAPQAGSNKRFTFLSTGVTSIVTLNIGSSPSIAVDLVLHKGATEVKAVKAFRSDIKEGTEDILRDPGRDPIHWDLASINSKVPGTDGSPLLVPKSFRIAVCVPENGAATVLSLFIHVHGDKHGDDSNKLQSRWDGQWATWKVSPIADPHTASIIFNSRLIINLATEWASSQGMTLQKVVKGPTDKWQGFKFKVLMGKEFYIPYHDRGHVRYGSTDKVDLDKDPNILTVILGQGGKADQHVEAMLAWEFKSGLRYQLSILPPGDGTLTVKLKKDLKKYADDSSLPNYIFRLNASLVLEDWENEVTSRDITSYLQEITEYDVMPILPWFRLELINCNFFLLQNLLLPGEKVIDFEATPGARLPLDAYIVGKVAHKSKVMARQAAHGASAST